MSSIKDRLEALIDENSPRLAEFLHHTWENQQNAITYKELREAILNGELSINYFLEWQQDYSRFINRAYEPIMQGMVKEAANDVLRRFSMTVRDEQAIQIGRFITDRGGRLIREVSVNQYTAINTLVRQATLTETLSIDHLARAIRPTIGLTTRQTQTTFRYYEKLREAGLSHKEAQQRQMTYAARMHRRRAGTIAQTEIAFAYNHGMDATVRQYAAEGLLPTMVKRWLTARNERVCKTCGPLHGEIVAMDSPFSIGIDLPPLHPNCQCKVQYLEEQYLTPAQRQRYTNQQQAAM
jgi:SPP1 gp7 family putative phage head morphogenesis protein